MVKAYGLTANGKPRTRRLRSELVAEMPPPYCMEKTPGYVWYDMLEVWVYIEDFHLIISVAEELANTDYTSRHGTRGTKNKGCAGPLCKKALRDGTYGGAKSAALARLDALLELLQAQHNSAFYAALSDTEKDKISATIEKYLRSMKERLDLVRTA